MSYVPMEQRVHPTRRERLVVADPRLHRLVLVRCSGWRTRRRSLASDGQWQALVMRELYPQPQACQVLCARACFSGHCRGKLSDISDHHKGTACRRITP